jgi:hypothetical protein
MIHLLAQAGTSNGVNLEETYLQNNPISTVDSIYGLVNTVLPNVYIIAGLILFIYALVGGFLIIASGSSADQAKNGQKIITNAIIGFIILFASYWLIEIISIITGIPILDPPTSLLN